MPNAGLPEYTNCDMVVICYYCFIIIISRFPQSIKIIYVLRTVCISNMSFYPYFISLQMAKYDILYTILQCILRYFEFCVD